MTNLTLLEEVDITLSKLRGKVSGYDPPFWSEEIQKLSRKLWIPTEAMVGANVPTNSWFDHKLFPPVSKSTKFLKENLKPDLDGFKTIKIRIFPDKDQRSLFQSWTHASRWVYNYTVDILDLYFKGKVSDTKVRDFIRTTERLEELVEGQARLLFTEYIITKKNEFPIPEWMEELKFNKRAYRGAIKNCVANWNSATSNKAAGNISKFKLKYRTKKDKNYFLSFENWCCSKNPFPEKLGHFRGWYKKGRVKFDLDHILEVIQHKNATLHWERVTNRYYMILPMSLDFNPILNGLFKGSQIKTTLTKSTPSEKQALVRKSMVALDPGVRTFQTCYSPTGLYEIGTGARVKLLKLFDRADQVYGKKKLKILLKVRNMVNDLHWKTIKLLCSSHSAIFLPTFNTSQMVNKKNSRPEVNRILLAFQHYKFQEKLVWKSKQWGVNVHIVNESYTSMTCTSCGELDRDHHGESIFDCPSCLVKIGHDHQGSRNIFLKSHNLLY